MTVTDLRLGAIVEILDRLASAVERVLPGDPALRDAAVRAGRLRADSLAAVDRVQQEIETFSPVRRDWCEEHNRTLEETDGLCPECEPDPPVGTRSYLVDLEALRRIETPMDAEADPPWLAGTIEHCLRSNMDFVRSLRYCLAVADVDRSHALDRTKPPKVSKPQDGCPDCGGQLDENGECPGYRYEKPNATAPVADPPWLDECRDFAWSHTGKKPHATDPEIAKAQNAIIRRVLAFANVQSSLPGFLSAAAREAGEAGRRADPPWIGGAVETFLACRPTEGSDRELLGRRLRAVLDWYNARPPNEKAIRTAEGHFLEKWPPEVALPAEWRTCVRAAVIAGSKARSGA